MLKSFYSVTTTHKSKPSFLQNAIPLMQSLRNSLSAQLETYTQSHPFLSTLPLLGVMKKTCSNFSPNLADTNNTNDQDYLIINYLASMTWSLDFFLSQFTHTESPFNKPSDRFQIMLKDSSINFETIKSHAMAVVGSGWTWLLMDSNSKLTVTNTFTADVPLFGNVTGHKPAAIGAKNDTTSSVSANALFSLLTRPVSVNGPMPTTNFIQPNEPARETQVRYTPLAVINMWEHAWIPDYAMNREAYIKDCWERINWQRVDALLS